MLELLATKGLQLVDRHIGEELTSSNYNAISMDVAKKQPNLRRISMIEYVIMYMLSCVV